ncbi:hypothetical protein [Halogeometricum luteum]|uniref:Integral membrane protein n=1 Tax=Halogeometricum luteum TaxID=2950537 RepID=A0ABU2G7F6_9EURY|nr:hypothetical protein [Halogeometricum sp. S3BR5-2]MDS0296093.1 hypothetical protein [Halogeometricum sp. S3BR5-2]
MHSSDFRRRDTDANAAVTPRSADDGGGASTPSSSVPEFSTDLLVGNAGFDPVRRRSGRDGWRSAVRAAAVTLAVVGAMLFASAGAATGSVFGVPLRSPVVLAVAALAGVFALRAGFLLAFGRREEAGWARERAGDALAVAALVGGSSYVLAVAAAPSPPWLLIGVGLGVGALLAFAYVRPAFPWSPNAYRTRFAAYARRLGARETLFGALLAEARADARADSELRIAVAEAEAALASARASLRQADSDLEMGLANDALFHFYSAKRDLIAVDYAVELLKDVLTEPAVSVTVVADADDAETGSATDPGGAAPAGTAATPVDLGGRLSPRARRYLASTATHVVTRVEAEFGSKDALTGSVRGRLYDSKGTVRPDVDVRELQQAAGLVQDRWRADARTERTVGRLLRLGTLVCLAGFAALLLLVTVGGAAGAFTPLGDLSVASTLAVVGLFGLFGALASALFDLKDISAAGPGHAGSSDPPVNRDLLLVRLVVGALMGVLAYVLVTSGVVTAVTDDPFDALLASPLVALSVAFAAGFVERLVADAVEEFAAGVTGTD